MYYFKSNNIFNLIILKNLFIIPLFLFFISCTNSQNQEKSSSTKEEIVKSKEDTIEHLTEEEKKSRNLIKNKLSEELLDFESFYKPLEYGTIEEYYLDWISSYNLRRLAKEQEKGQSLDVARAKMEEETIKFFKNFGTRNQDTRKGLRLYHKFKYKKDGGIKTTTLMFYFDPSISNILYVEKINNVAIPEL